MNTSHPFGGFFYAPRAGSPRTAPMPVNEADFREARTEINDHGQRLATLEEWKTNVSVRIDTFVTKTEFTLVKAIVYTLAGTTLTSVLAALLAKVIVK